MQFLRRQRKGRKRKTYLERIGLSDSIESADKFYEHYNIIKKLESGGQGTIYSIEINPKSDEKKEEYDEGDEGNETNDYSMSLVVKIISFAEFDHTDDIQTELIKASNQYQLTSKTQLLRQFGIYYDENKKELLIITEELKTNLNELRYSNNKLSEDELKSIMSDILNKMNTLHSLYYIHCDITPFNVMCNYKNEWTLIDYDMMMQIDEKRGYINDCWKGTISWTSPEIGNDVQSANNLYSFTSDIWSFGLCLFYILNDFKNPFDLNDNDINHIINGDDEIELNELNEMNKLEYFYKYKLTEKEHEENIQCLLIEWFATERISENLYDLLLNHLLVFDVTDRIKSCQHIIYHPWFYDHIKKNKDKYQFDMIS